jgi:hypothetical protein
MKEQLYFLVSKQGDDFIFWGSDLKNGQFTPYFSKDPLKLKQRFLNNSQGAIAYACIMAGVPKLIPLDKEIAEAMQVSVATISRCLYGKALTNKQEISEAFSKGLVM